MSFVADTHVAVWAIEDNRRLGRRARAILNKAAAGEALYLSAVSMWEIGRLVQRGRIGLAWPLRELRGRLLERGFREIALSGDIALEAVRFADDSYDPADAFIVASALAYDATLVTADSRILAWSGPLKRHDAER